MKILVGIPHYSESHNDDLVAVLTEYEKIAKSLGASIDITMYVRSIWQPPQLDVKMAQKLYSDDIAWTLTLPHKIDFQDEIENYDLFIYSEDDILINADNVSYFLEHSEKLTHTNCVPGFLRWEGWLEYKYLFDCTVINSYFRGGTVIFRRGIGGMSDYFEPTNIHQGCYCFTQAQLKRVIKSGRYIAESRYTGKLEGVASDVYFDCGLKKVISIKDIEKSLVHHLNNKYMLQGDFVKENPPNVKRLLAMVNDPCVPVFK